jgi:hypothetical protein
MNRIRFCLKKKKRKAKDITSIIQAFPSHRMLRSEKITFLLDSRSEKEK